MIGTASAAILVAVGLVAILSAAPADRQVQAFAGCYLLAVGVMLW